MSANSASPVGRWRSAPADQILWSEWDGDYVGYHRPSGKTHFLNAATFDLLDKVLREPCEVEAAVARLRALHPTETESSYFGEYVAELLLRLEQLGLVVRV